MLKGRINFTYRIPPRHPGGVRGLAVALAIWAMWTWAAACRAGDVVVVLSSEALPYQQAEAGLREQVTANVRSLPLKDLLEKGVEATIGKNTDAVIAIGTPAAVWLHKQLPAAMPLVYCLVSDPAGEGLLEKRTSYGISLDVPIVKQFAIIAEALPRARTVGLLYTSKSPNGQRQLKLVTESLPKDWRIEAVAVDKHESIAGAIDELAKRRVDVIWTAPDPEIYNVAGVRALLLTSLRTGTPVFGFSTAFVKAGALLGIGVNPKDEGRQVGTLTLRVLKAAEGPAIKQVTPTEHYEIAINLIVADKLRITLPEGLIRRAVHVFKDDR